MLTTILAALSGQLGTLLSNPIARKIGIVALIGAGLWYANKLSMNHAYDQGKNEGARAAWVEAQSVQQKVWDAAQDDIKKQYDAVSAQAKAVVQEQADFAAKHAVIVEKRQETEKKVTTEITKAEQQYTAAPVQDDGLPAKTVILDVLKTYKDAYESTNRELQITEQEYQDSVTLQNKSILEKTQQIDVLTKDLNLTQKQLAFYKDGFDQVAKKHGGFGHFLKKVFTLGLAR